MKGHGHVIPNPDGSRARCGGPGLCGDCTSELVAMNRARDGQPSPSPSAIAAAIEILELPAAFDYLCAATSRQGWMPGRMVQDEALGITTLAAIIDKHMTSKESA
jgi:hypothetical protein